MLQWNDTPYWSELELPIGRLTLRARGYSSDPEQNIIAYKIVIEDGEYGDGGNFAEKEIAIADLEAAKQEAIAFLREKIQETLTLLDEG
jgi:hypothetical protein